MRLAILRRAPQASVSMDVYADAIVTGLRALHPTWEILEIHPTGATLHKNQYSLTRGLQKYYERFWRYPQSLRHLEVDVAHIIDHTDGYLVKHLQRLGIPTVVTCHDIINWVRPDWFRGKAAMPWLSMATWKYAVQGMARADRIFTVSDYTAKDLTRYLSIPPQQIAVTPNGVDDSLSVLPEADWLPLRQRYGVVESACVLLNVGSNNPRKNVLGILKALVCLRDQGLPVHFWKAGDDFDLPQQQFIAAHGLCDRITYLGKPDQPTLTRLYNAADILVAPSLYEGFGLTVLEAMACGTPVITANTTALPEVAGDAALLVDPLDSDAIAQAILNLWQDTDLQQRLKDRGLARVKTFTWEKTTEKLTDIYLDVLKK